MDIERERRAVRRFDHAQDELLLNASDLSLGTIASMVDAGKIDINPGFQRRERWTTSQRVALIESYLLNIPVPPVYLAEEAKGVYSVIDGKQRISAIRDFLRGDFSLRGLELFTELEGLHFSELPDDLQSALILRPYVRAVFLLKNSGPGLKLIAFHRLNTGGEQLNAQEVRNNAFQGPLNGLLHELSGNVFLRGHLKIRDNLSPNYKTMYDLEVVLRFFMMRTHWRNFGGALRRELDSFMVDHQRAGDAEIDELRTSFNDSIDLCRALWGSNAFQRPEGNGWRLQFLAGVYDAQMVACDTVRESDVQRIVSHRTEIIARTRALFEYDEFSKAVRSATNTPRSVRLRLDTFIDLLTQYA